MFNVEAYEGKIPHRLLDSLVIYGKTGRPTGGFLAAYLSNDLFRALGAADDDSRAAFTQIGFFIYNELPRGCWGRPEAVREWIGHRGLEGLEAKNEPVLG